MRHVRFAAAVLLVGLAGPVAAKPFNHLFVFSDSLADTGTLYAATEQVLGQGFPPAPYADGRFSDGPVWVEYLAERARLPEQRVRNDAVGYAGAGDVNYFAAFSGVPTTPEQQQALADAGVVGVKTQVERFLDHGKIKKNGLYVVGAGGNDYLFGTRGLDPTQLPGFVTATVGNVLSSVNALADAGARRILVGNVPDLASTPFGASQPEAVRAVLSSLIGTHNQALATAVPALATARGIDAQVVDAAGFLREVLADPASFGFTNVAVPCIAAPATCGASVFFDPVHPTTAVHAQIGDLAYAQVVPLPASALMLAPAMAGIVWLRRRKSA